MRQSATEWVPQPCAARVGKHDTPSIAVNLSGGEGPAVVSTEGAEAFRPLNSAPKEHGALAPENHFPQSVNPQQNGCPILAMQGWESTTLNPLLSSGFKKCGHPQRSAAESGP